MPSLGLSRIQRLQKRVTDEMEVVYTLYIYHWDPVREEHIHHCLVVVCAGLSDPRRDCIPRLSISHTRSNKYIKSQESGLAGVLVSCKAKTKKNIFIYRTMYHLIEVVQRQSIIICCYTARFMLKFNRLKNKF